MSVGPGENKAFQDHLKTLVFVILREMGAPQ